MKSVKVLTISQLAQRVDELIELQDSLDVSPQWLNDRLNALNKELMDKMNDNTFNKGVITPLPPDHIDGDNPFVVTPKAPAQVERERENWERSLND